MSAAGANSDAELGARVLAGWERMARAVPDGPRHNRRLAERFGVQVREIEHVRDVRNRVAHPGERISRQDLERAIAILKRSGSSPARSRPARARASRPRPRSARPGSAQARRTAARTRTVAKARKAKRQLVALATVLAVLAVVVVVVLSVR